jgi:Caspase domain
MQNFLGDEDDGYDETLIPVDFKTAGQIVDDDILKILVQPMAEGVTCTVLMVRSNYEPRADYFSFPSYCFGSHLLRLGLLP